MKYVTLQAEFLFFVFVRLQLAALFVKPAAASTAGVWRER